jgi:chromatin segregation and condensation protein Rec8/ScpA/Scc1 (kleisin family)
LRPPPWPKTASALRRRSTVACTFLAALELTRQGITTLRQEKAFGTVYLQYQSNPANAATADDQAS